MKNTTAIILCAGMGVRLKPLTDHTPKCLIKVGHETLLSRLLRQMDQLGVKETIVVGGHLSGSIAAFLNNLPSRGKIRLIENPDFLKTNNAVSLGMALHEITGGFLIVDGDLWLSDKIIQSFSVFQHENFIVADPDPERLTGEAMKVLAGCKAEVLKLSKGLESDQAWGEYIGLARLDANWARALNDTVKDLGPEDRNTCYYEDVINRLIGALPAIHLLSTQEQPWTEIDSLEDLHEAQKIILRQSQYS